MKSITQSTLTLAIAIALMGLGATGAFFSDVERASGNTFAAGVIDLLVDNESYYNGNKCTDVDESTAENWQWVGTAAYPPAGTPCSTSWIEDDLADGHLFFNFTDLKPDDEGEDTISLHVNGNDAWACMNIALTANDDASSTEPELGTGDVAEDANDAWDGELAQAIEFVWWADDGDNVLEAGERLLSEGVQTLYDLATSSGAFSVALADSQHNVWDEEGPIPGNETRYIGKAWCLGDMTLAAVAGNGGVSPSVNSGVLCDGTTLGNDLQSDNATLDVSFFTYQARHDSAYLCPEPETPPVACEVTQQYADEVVSVDQGLRKDSSAVLLTRSDATKALGAPQSLGTPYDDTASTTILNGFFSLGFPLGGNAAEIILSFNDNYVVNGAGSDLKLWEVTGGTSYPDERVDVYVGNTPTGPWTQVGDNVSRDAEIDLGAVTVARYVRIVDASDISLFEQTADGFDLDAVQALNCVVSPVR